LKLFYPLIVTLHHFINGSATNCLTFIDKYNNLHPTAFKTIAY
jgi:hypothetical protein